MKLVEGDFWIAQLDQRICLTCVQYFAVEPMNHVQAIVF